MSDVATDTGPERPTPAAGGRPLWPRWRFGSRSVAPGPVKAVIAVAVVGYLFTIPQTFGRTDVNRFSLIMCLALAALGVNLLTGFNGQISVGHGAFYGVGAYTAFLLVADQEWPFWAAAAGAAVVTFALGLLVGLPALRIRGLYLAVVTLALAALFPQVLKRFGDLTGGSQGRQITRQETPEVYDFNRPPEGSDLAPDQWRFYVILIVTVIAFVLVRNLVRSRVGRALIATRDNETAAEVVGVPLARMKVVTFGLSAMLAGIGGAMQTYLEGSVNPSKFEISLSIEILVMVVVGGAATIIGPAIGAFLVVELPEWLPSDTPQASLVLFGLLLVLLMRVAPGGVVGLSRQLWAKVARRVNPPPGARPVVASGGSPPD